VQPSEPDGVRPVISKAVNGISTKQRGGEKPLSAARNQLPHFAGKISRCGHRVQINTRPISPEASSNWDTTRRR